MSLITFSNVSKFYQSDLILDHISFSINKNEKVALIGNNGTGKTTIFKLILHEEEVSLFPKEDKPGEIAILGNLRIGYLDQNAIANLSNTVKEELLTCFDKQIKIQTKIVEISREIAENPENFDLLNKLEKLLKEQEELGQINYENRISEMLNRFGYDDSFGENVISTLSGGERMKVAFIKILLSDFDIMLLDEPTNHLDISTIEWLENYLMTINKSIVFISHDRFFLESIATKIIEIENKKTVTYNMDYNHYLLEKSAKYEYLLKKAKEQDKEIERLKRFIEFYKPKPRFVSRAKDKEKKLQRLEENKINVPKKDKKVKFDIKGENLKKKQLLEIKDLVIGYDSPLCPPFNLDVYGKDKLAICGDNGIGKTTLIKTITLQIPNIFGEIIQKRKLKFGYIQQNDFSFDEALNPFDFIKKRHPNLVDTEVRNALGKFLFSRDDVYQSISSMSNGEKMRLVLCEISLQECDILFLDEPTNHLDMLMKEALIDALKQYKGCIIFISHDRYFINSIADHILYLSKDRVLALEGDYNTLRKVLDRIESNKLISIDEIEKPKVVKTEKLSNNQLTKLKTELETIEKRLEEIDIELEKDFESFDILNVLTDEKDDLEERYIEIMEILEKDNKIKA